MQNNHKNLLRAAASCLTPEDRKRFVLLDFRGDSIAACEVLERAWAESGYYLSNKELYNKNIESILEIILPWQCPIIYVVSDGYTMDKQILQKLISCVRNGQRLLQIKQRDTLFYDSYNQLIDDTALLHLSETTTLILQGVKEYTFHYKNLPVKLELECTNQSRQGGYFQIGGSNPHCDIPPPVWFKCNESRKGELVVSIAPNYTKEDQWELTFNGRQISSTKNPTLENPNLPENIVVIFDRTCPDQKQWSNARAISLGYMNKTKDTSRGFLADEDPISDEDNELLYHDFNLEIRTALGIQLKELLQDEKIMIHGFWFGDIPGNGLVCPKGVRPLPSPAGETGQKKPKQALDLFSSMTFSPGLDIWDQIEKALVMAVTKLDRNPAGIIIIGNSPPSFPYQVNSPIFEISKAFGFQSSYRHQSAEWHILLDECQKKGMPLVYLFLNINAHKINQEETSDYNNFLHVQSRVCSALKKCMPLVTADADENGIKQGLKETLELLKDPYYKFSGIKVKKEIA